MWNERSELISSHFLSVVLISTKMRCHWFGIWCKNRSRMINEARGWELILSLAVFLFGQLEQSLKAVQTVLCHMWELMDKGREAKRCTPPGGSIYDWMFVLGPLLGTDVTQTTPFFFTSSLLSEDTQQSCRNIWSFKEKWNSETMKCVPSSVFLSHQWIWWLKINSSEHMF